MQVSNSYFFYREENFGRANIEILKFNFLV